MAVVFFLFCIVGIPDSKTFDVTLMAVLLNNLTGDYARYDDKPCNSSIKPEHDLARIIYYRNQLAHRKDAKIESTYFENDWKDICGVRLYYLFTMNSFLFVENQFFLGKGETRIRYVQQNTKDM